MLADLDDPILAKARSHCNALVNAMQEAAGFFRQNDFDDIDDAVEAYWRLSEPEGLAMRMGENTCTEEEVLDLVEPAQTSLPLVKRAQVSFSALPETADDRRRFRSYQRRYLTREQFVSSQKRCR